MSYGNGNGGGVSPGAGGAGAGAGAGGGPESSPNILNLGNATADADLSFVETSYTFTDPPRYFKANDPYYFEVDNIPLKQLHENCLWLRDQIAGKDLTVTGVSTRKITDLQPWVNNSDRVIHVRPGKFTGRVNDAYGAQDWAKALADQDPLVDIARKPIFKNASTQLEDSVYQTLVGATVTNLLYNNGLYENYHHHAASITVSPPADSSPSPTSITVSTNLNPTFFSSTPLKFSDLPKIKTAVWQQVSDTSRNVPYKPDLQQLSVDFCRRWKGVFRTSVINVPSELSINIPAFDPDDYLNNTVEGSYEPQVRIDLVFLYTHPIDSTESNLIRSGAGDAPTKITTPVLGVVKGAGSILTPASSDGSSPLSINSDPSLIGSPEWSQQRASLTKFYKTQQGLSDVADMSITSPISDQVAGDGPFPGKNTGRSFPSPDDLLNLAPIISQDATSESLATLGQSVLPLCYVIVKKNVTVIREEDIIDIRPFLRTAELTYNERAGVAAANPPLSLANPATGKAELYTAIESVRDYLIEYLSESIVTQSITSEKTKLLSEAGIVNSGAPILWGTAANNKQWDLGTYVDEEHLGKVKYFLFRLEARRSDLADQTSLYFTNGTGINDVRLVGKFEGTGDAANTVMPHSFIWPGTQDGTNYTLSTYANFSFFGSGGDPQFQWTLYVDGYVFEDSVTITTSTGS